MGVNMQVSAMKYINILERFFLCREIVFLLHENNQKKQMKFKIVLKKWCKRKFMEGLGAWSSHLDSL